MFRTRIFSPLTITAALMITAVGNSAPLNAGRQAGVLPDVAAQAEAALGKALAGTWIVNVDQPGFPPSQRHFTFNSDGGMIANDDVQLGPNGVDHFTIAQGSWIRTGNRAVAATIVGQRHSPEGSFLGTFKVRMNLELNQVMTEWTARFRIDVRLPGGQVIFTSEGAFAATRLEVEPL